jgi:hypothetical protein
MLMLSIASPARAEGQQKIEIFDIKQKNIIQSSQMNPDIQAEAERFLKEITDIYKKFNPIPNEGYMVRIPLEPSVMVQNQWMHALVNEAVFIFPKEGKPYLMMLDDENIAHFFTFKRDTSALLDHLDFHPETLQ